MYTNVSGQLAITRQLELIANNLANANTSGYLAERPLFEKVLVDQDTLLTTSLRKDVQEPNPYQTDAYTMLKGSYTDFSQGPLEMTKRPLDVAITGPGFFVVQTAQGERYTRSGNFTVDRNSRLVTQSGDPVMGDGGEMTISGNNLSVSNEGEIKSDQGVLGKLRVVELDPKGILREPGQLFALKSGSVARSSENPQVQGGALEGSNVNAVRELADMIMASRLFEGLKTAQEQASKMNEARNNRVGSTQG